VLKERRRLVLMVRETPLHTGHLRTMTALSEMGAVIAPPVPAFYTGATRWMNSSPRASVVPGPVRDQRYADQTAGRAEHPRVSQAQGRGHDTGCCWFAVVLLDMIGFGIVIPILPFITPRLGGSTSTSR
jgi:hypothetical protein